MVRKDNTYQTFTENQLEPNSDTDQNQNICSYIYPTISEITSFTCIITDLTNPQNTCRRHAITLSSTYSIENLIQEASNYYSYDPFSFNLMWKCNNEMLNVSEIQSSSLSLSDLGLSSINKNIFEIHEKEGPPKRLKVDDFGYNNNSSLNQSDLFAIDEEEWLPNSGRLKNNLNTPSAPSLQFGPVNMNNTNNNNTISSISSSFNYEEENNCYVGLINQAMTCYLNSLIQTLFMTPEFRNGIYRWNYLEALNDQDDPKKNIPFQLQRLFLNLQTSNKKSIQTHDLTKSFGWNSDDAFQQHDVQELCRVMFDALEKKFKKTKQENLINELYQGKIKDYVKCLECNTESARVDVYLDIPLCIRPFGSETTYESVEAAIDGFMQPEILDENNKYFCEKCKKMCKAHKGLKFESFPYIISLQLKRFDFDYKTLSRLKIGSKVTFPEILNVKKYLKNDEYDKNKNEEDDTLYDYELFSIMIHSGSATGGHYYAYIKSFETNQWYNFNDERVTKIDKNDIEKTFGTSFSIYNSTTAYMLQYRQINKKRNENFIKVDEFEEHLKNLLNKEINEQLEAKRLKEYMENMCKVKVIVPPMAIPNDPVTSSSSSSTVTSASASTSSSFSSSSLSMEQNGDLANEAKISNSMISNCQNEQNFSRKIEKTIEIHKDLTMIEAKNQIIKDLNLSDYLNATSQKCRILKYDSNNNMIEQSYQNEFTLTVYEALGLNKCPYFLSWYVEILPENEEFVDYNPSDINIKILNLNLETFETNELFSIRLNYDSAITELRDKIAKKITINPEKIRMALEKLHTLNNYVYLNKTLDESLKSVNFTRVNKVYIEYQDENDSNTPFQLSKFYYSLDTMINIYQIIIYLPIEEQCEIYLKKSKRRNDFIENQRRIVESKTLTDINDEATIDSYDTIASEQTLSSIVADSTATDQLSDFNQQKSPKIINLNQKISNEYDNDDSMSKMSYQEVSKIPVNESINLIENHFKQEDGFDYKIKNHDENRIFMNEMETSLDEGIGGSDGSLSTNNLNLKSSPNIVNWYELKIKPCVDEIKSSNDVEDENIGNDIDEDRSPCDLDVNVDDNEINNLNDDLDDNVQGLLDLIDLPEERMDRVTFLNEDKKDDLNSRISHNSNYLLNENYTSYSYDYSENKSQVKNDLGIEQDFDKLPKYSDLEKENFKSIDNKFLRCNSKNERYIKSNLIENKEFGTRTLEIRMDKRIDFTDFKSHLDNFLKIGAENFRVFRMNTNDIETEIKTSMPLYLEQNSKFLIKLGPSLKDDEYIVPVYKLNKAKGSFSYLCDFMIKNNFTVLNHKKLLIDDLKDECELEIPLEKLRMRKKISKRPGAILLDTDIFGKDVFLNGTSEICIEILEESEKKISKAQTSIYLRHWKPDSYELAELEEIIIDGNTFDILLKSISCNYGIDIKNIELLKCLRDFPFKSPILDLHRNLAWKENCFISFEKLEDGSCYYFRDKTLRLAELSSEKRSEIGKLDNMNFRSTTSFSANRKEIGIKIHVENS